MADADVPPVALVVGDEALLVAEAVRALIDAHVDPAVRSLNLAEFSAGDAGGALSLARTQPMMAARRVVIVRDMNKAPVPFLDALLEYVDDPNPSTVLVLTGPKLPPPVERVDRGQRLANRVRKKGLYQRFRAGERGPVPFAVDHAERAGCRLETGAARLLVELVGSDLATVRSELDKAIAYVGGSGNIDVQTIAQVSSMVAEAVVWDLTDAVLQRNRDRALSATHRLLEESASGDGEVHRLLALVTWQMRQLLELQASLRTGGDLPGTWKRVPSRKLRNARDSLSARPLGAARVLGALADANRSLNRSRAGYRRVFEALVLELTR